MTAAPSQNEIARNVWARLKSGLENSPSLLDELLGAVSSLLGDYDSSIRENRFIVGGATERILATAMRAAGIANVRSRGLAEDKEDLVVDGVGISVKSSFTGRRDQIRLINTLGDSAARWSAPTIFIIAERGIGYADPGLLPNATRAARDAVILPRAPLDAFHDRNPDYFLACAVPRKPMDPTQTKVASESVANEIMARTANGRAVYPLLRNHL